MDAHDIQCPTCGGTTTLANRFVKLVVCAYCEQTLAVDQGKVDPLGKAGPLHDMFSHFNVGAVMTLDGRDANVAGRVRYEYDDGYWDEWIVLFADDGAMAWVHEDEGELTVLTDVPLQSSPDIASARVGANLDVDGRPVYVTEKRKATAVGGEGQIPREVRFGQELVYVDGTVEGETVMLEAIGGQVAQWRGRELDPDAVEVRLS